MAYVHVSKPHHPPKTNHPAITMAHTMQSGIQGSLSTNTRSHIMASDFSIPACCCSALSSRQWWSFTPQQCWTPSRLRPVTHPTMIATSGSNRYKAPQAGVSRLTEPRNRCLHVDACLLGAPHLGVGNAPNFSQNEHPSRQT